MVLLQCVFTKVHAGESNQLSRGLLSSGRFGGSCQIGLEDQEHQEK